MKRKLIGFHTGYSSKELVLICTKMESSINRIKSEYGIFSFRRFKTVYRLATWSFFNASECGILTPQIK